MKRIIPLLLISAWLLGACSFSLAEDITPPPGSEQMPSVGTTQPVQVSGPMYPLVPPDPENGRTIYAEKCTPCHGAQGRGDGPQASQLPNPAAPIGSTELAYQATPAEWYGIVTNGNLERFMPPFASLSDSERWDVVAYSFSLSMSEADLELGAGLYQANCASCHGDDGRGDGPAAADLGAEVPDLTDQEAMAQRTATDFFNAVSNGVPPSMPAFTDSLSEDERWALASYIRSLTFSTASTAPLAQETTSEPYPYPYPEPAENGEVSSAATPVAVADRMGTVTGQVVNASGDNLPTGLDVTLRGFDDMQEVYSSTTTLSSAGMFEFDDVQLLSGRVFMATIVYEDTTYGSDISVIEGNENNINLPITVYGTTTDASVLSVDRLHMFFEFADENTLRVIELYILSNPSNLTVVPKENGEPAVRFVLPEGAQNLEFQDGTLGERYSQTEDGFGDTIAVRPGAGTYEILFAFEMPYDRRLEMVQPVLLPVGAVVILVPEGGVNISSDMLSDEGLRDVQGVQYRLYNGEGIPAGQDLRLTLSGRPASGGGLSLVSGDSSNLVIGLGVFGLALLVTGVWLFRRSRSTEEETEFEDVIEDDTSPEVVETENIDSLMDAIIALDDLYQEGSLPEEAYLKRRAELKARLQAQMQDE